MVNKRLFRKPLARNIAFSIACFLTFGCLIGALSTLNKQTFKVYGISGSGTEVDPYQLSSYEDLKTFRSKVASGENSAWAVLTDDIDCPGSSDMWSEPIGIEGLVAPYTGTFDGQNHIISSIMFYKRSGGSDVTASSFGLFGEVSGGVVKNLTLANGSFEVGESGSTKNLGGFVGKLTNGGRIENCHLRHFKVYNTYSNTNSDGTSGGIAGYIGNSSIVSKCSVINTHDEDFYGDSVSGLNYVGGIAGSCTEGQIIDSFVDSDIVITDLSPSTDLPYRSAGGISGRISGATISNCHYYGYMSIYAGSSAALAGREVATSTISNFYYHRQDSYLPGQADASGIAKKLTTDEFKAKASFENWSFGDIWRMGDDYPVLDSVIFTITLDNQDATTAGTTTIYESKGRGFYLDSTCETEITSTTGITIPTLEKYSFGGYYTEVEGGGVKYIDEDGYLTEEADNDFFSSSGYLYAYWTYNYSPVTITAGAGVSGVYLSESKTATSGSTSGTEFENGTVVYGFAILAKGYNAPTGWTWLSGSGEGAIYRVNGSVKAGDSEGFATVDAEAIEYTLRLYYEGGSATNPDKYTVEDTITLSNPTRTGYIFTGWDGTDLVGEDNMTVTFNGIDKMKTLVYTAHWVAKSYTVYLDGVSDPITATWGEVLEDVEIPAVPEGYTFYGYYDEPDGAGSQYIDKDGHGILAWDKDEDDVTLYPNSTIDMTVTSSGYNGNWAPSATDPSVGVGRSITVTVTNPADGYDIYYGNSETTCGDTDISHFTYTEVGSYTVYFEVRKENYTTYKGSETVVISKAGTIIEPIPSEIGGITYTGLEQELITAGVADYGEMYYAVNTTGEAPSSIDDMSTDIPVGTNVGVYYVYYAAKGDSNHSDTSISYITSEIKRVDRSEIESLNQTVVLYLSDIQFRQEYEDIYNDLSTTRSNIYQDAIVEDNVTSEFVEGKRIELLNAYNDAKAITDTVDNVESLIDDIPTPSESADYYDAVEVANNAYNGITDITIKNTIDSTDYPTILNYHLSIKITIKLIQDIGDITYNGGTDDSLEDIVNAETSFSALTSEQQDVVKAINYNKLTSARTTYDHVDNVAKLIKNIPEASTSEDYYNAVDTAKVAYDLLTEKEIEILDVAVDLSYEKIFEDNVAAKETITLIENIGISITYNSGKGDSLDSILRAYISYIKLTKDQSDIVDEVNYDDLLERIRAYNRIDKVADLIKTISTRLDAEAYINTVTDAEDAYFQLSDDDKAILNASSEFKYLEVLQDSVTTKEVVVLIYNIGEITFNGGVNDSKEDIEKAEAAYDLLSEEHKAIVDSINHQDLVNYSKSYENVETTVNLISSIGDINYGGEHDSKEAIEQARESYNALPEHLKELVSGYNNSYQTLDDGEHVYDVLELIDEIGNVDYNALTAEKINKAREAYNALSEEQKAKVNKDSINNLVNAEAKYTSLASSNNIVAVIILSVSSVALLVGAVFLYLLNKKKGPFKAMSISGFIPLILTVSYLSKGLFIAAYIILGAAIIIWLVFLFTFLNKRKKKQENTSSDK